ncbi:hypothetical protein ACGFOU_09590 [Streptomyces sp. NPDC048595]|uniref:hypothetical protein n=1 Tax=Streptomyces sp. NPDC048595 TaxID=3365576 RepID=UPI003722157F
MKLFPGDLTYQVLAGSHRHYHHSTSHYGGDGVLDWWEWVILAVGAVLVVWALVKKFTSD